MNTIQLKNDIYKLLLSLREIFNDSPWEEECTNRISKIKDELDHPCVLAIAGIVNAGKSSFINAFLRGNYAPVGHTETTATINYFTFDKDLNSVPDKQKPILCFWTNNTNEWVSQEFLDSLQGHEEDVLKKSMDIDHLEYFLNNPVLDGIRLVDTPGVGAITANDEHDRRTKTFIKSDADILRERHSKETQKLAEEADALICLSDNIVKDKDLDLVTDFLKNFNRSSDSDSNAMLKNLMVILGQADKYDILFGDECDAQKYLDKEAAQLKDKDINAPIAAVSAELETALTRINKNVLQIMHQELQSMSDTNRQLILINEALFQKDSYYSPSTAFTNELRNDIVSHTPWSIIKRIIEEFVKEKDFEKALNELKRKSGFDQVREILEEKFIKRGKLLHYKRKLNDLINWVYNIKENDIPDRREQIFEITREILRNPYSIDSFRDELNNQLSDQNVYMLDRIKQNLEDLQDDLTQIHLRIEHELDKYDALKAIKQSQFFSEEEKKELENLFSNAPRMNDNLDFLRNRCQYWRFESISGEDNRKFAAGVAETCYNKIISHLLNTQE